MLRPAGLQLVAAAEDERQALADWLGIRSIGHVVDVGANYGQFAQQLLDKGYAGAVHCFEPLSEAHSGLTKRFAGNSRVEVLPRTAIGATSGVVTMNVAGNSVSSSARPMLQSHESAAPRSAYVREEEAPLTTLDTQFGDANTMFEQGVMLKIDTQGFEADVLRGAKDILPKCQAVLIEMSTTPLYQGQALWDELHQMLVAAGFALWNVMPDFRDPITGQLLQFDGLYVKA